MCRVGFSNGLQGFKDRVLSVTRRRRGGGFYWRPHLPDTQQYRLSVSNTGHFCNKDISVCQSYWMSRNELHLLDRFCVSQKVNKIGRNVFPLLDTVSLTYSCDKAQTIIIFSFLTLHCPFNGSPELHFSSHTQCKKHVY